MIAHQAPSAQGPAAGSPTAQVAGRGFRITVSAVDSWWNVVAGVSNTVDVYSSDAAAILPARSAARLDPAQAIRM